VPTGYGYTLPDQNGWSRALHFQTAWLLVLTGVLYVGVGITRGHFRKNLVPDKSDLAPKTFLAFVGHHLRFQRPSESEAWSYNVLQRLAYLAVIFILFPLVVWTGLALSPAFDAAFPATVNLLGGRQTARTLHFFVTIALVLFVLVHMIMVWRAGFFARLRSMITGHVKSSSEQV
jgi:thiosulfate reductase cytochrome b subunit